MTKTACNNILNFSMSLGYMNIIFQTRPVPDTVSQFARGYEDYLQCPLQPLMDNLESQTYEIFEKDPIKYSQYQKVNRSLSGVVVKLRAL